MNKIILLFIVFLCCATFAQSQQRNSSSTLIKIFNQNSKKSLVANDGLITDLRAKINSEESTLSEKSTITDLMLQHFIEKGEFLEFKKLYNQHAVLFKNDPLKLYYWNSIYYNYPPKIKINHY